MNQADQLFEHYQRGLAGRIRRAAGFVRQFQDQPERIQAHIHSLLTLVDHGQWDGDTYAAWLELVELLEPYPLIWGYGEAWEDQLSRALAGGRMDDFRRAGVQASLANAAFDNAHIEAARASAEAACALARRGSNPVALARAGLVAARIDHRQGHDDVARAALAELSGEALTLCAGLESSVWGVCQAHLNLLRCDWLRFAGDAAAALNLYDQIIAGMQVYPGERWISRAQFDLFSAELYESRGVLRWARGDYTAASLDMSQASQVYARQADQLNQASVLANLGLVYWKMCKFDLAEQAQLQSIAIRQARNAQSSLVRVVGDLGMVYFLRGSLDQAAAYIQRQQELAERYADRSAASLAFGNLCAVRIFQGRGEEALAGLQQALAGAQQRSKEHELGAILDLMPCYWFLGRESEAREAAQRMLAIAEELREGIPGIIVPVLRGLALTQPSIQARETLRQAMDLARAHDRIFDLAACQLSLAGLTSGQAGRELWQAGAALLAEMGAQAWLNGRSRRQPPFLPLVV